MPDPSFNPPSGAQEISIDEQTARRVNGESVHRIGVMQIIDEHGAVVRTVPIDECTPDFSCCRPALLAAPEVRQAFAAASKSEQSRLLGAFLAALLEHEELADKATISVPGAGPAS
jgi:hypothetical protein